MVSMVLHTGWPIASLRMTCSSVHLLSCAVGAFSSTSRFCGFSSLSTQQMNGSE